MPLSSISISELPIELLIQIGGWTVQRHPLEGYAVDTRDLAAFSATSRLFRAIALPLLLNDIPIVSERQLFHLAQLDAELLSFTRHLNVFLDLPFFESFKFWGFVRGRPGPPSARSPYDALATVLSRTPLLHTLRIRLAQLTGLSSSWTPIFHQSPFTVPLSDALSRSKVSFSLPHLSILELDGFASVQHLLRATPNLQALRMRVSGGYSDQANAEFVSKALRHTPNLKELTYTAGSLRIEDDLPVMTAPGPWNFHNPDAAGDVNGEQIEEGTMLPGAELEARVQLLSEIAKRTNGLQILDLRAVRCDYGVDRIAFCSPRDALPSTTLAHALANLPDLRSVDLPSTVLAPGLLNATEGRRAIRIMNADSDDTTDPFTLHPTGPPVSSLTAAQKWDALEGVRRAEYELASSFLIVPDDRKVSKTTLRSISFVRPSEPMAGADAQSSLVLTSTSYTSSLSSLPSSARSLYTKEHTAASTTLTAPLPSSHLPTHSYGISPLTLAQTLSSIHKMQDLFRKRVCGAYCFVRSNSFQFCAQSLHAAMNIARIANDASPQQGRAGKDYRAVEATMTDNPSSSLPLGQQHALDDSLEYEYHYVPRSLEPSSTAEQMLSRASIGLAAIGGYMIGDAFVAAMAASGQEGLGMLMTPPLVAGLVGGAVMALPGSR